MRTEARPRCAATASAVPRAGSTKRARAKIASFETGCRYRSAPKSSHASRSISVRVAMAAAHIAPMTPADFLEDAAFVDVGNPHVVLFRKQVDDVIDRDAGQPTCRTIRPSRGHQRSRRAAGRDGSLRVRHWERGVGLTMACGTGAVACAPSRCERRNRESPVQVFVPGGRLVVEWDGSARVSHRAGGAGLRHGVGLARLVPVKRARWPRLLRCRRDASTTRKPRPFADGGIVREAVDRRTDRRPGTRRRRCFRSGVRSRRLDRSLGEARWPSLPAGYTRLLLPAYVADRERAGLAAVRLHVCLRHRGSAARRGDRTDESEDWQPRHFAKANSRMLVARRLARATRATRACGKSRAARSSTGVLPHRTSFSNEAKPRYRSHQSATRAVLVASPNRNPMRGCPRRRHASPTKRPRRSSLPLPSTT